MIWLIGSNGMLGSEVAKLLDENKLLWVGTNSEVDITSWEAVCNYEKSVETASYYPSPIDHSEREIKWIINCAAYTDVDGAEDEVEKAAAVNIQGVTNICRLCRKIGAKLIHISTDYVFDGRRNRPYTEIQDRKPVNMYGLSKAKGEIAIEKEMVQYYIIRSSWLYGANGKNFVNTMLEAMNNNSEIAVVNDQKGCPTYAGNLASVILKLLNKNDTAKEVIGPKSAPAYGIYHYCDAGETTWYDFAKEINKSGKKYGLISGDCEVTACTSEAYGAKAKRPKYSSLDSSKISKELKLKIPSWKASLDKYLKSLKK